MSDEELAAEARLLGCYLVGREPGAPLVDRYARANRALLAAPAEPRDGAIPKPEVSALPCQSRRQVCL